MASVVDAATCVAASTVARVPMTRRVKIIPFVLTFTWFTSFWFIKKDKG